MRRLAWLSIIPWVLAIVFIASIPAHAIDVYISDRGGSHVGYCEDNGLFGDPFANAVNLNYGAATNIWVGASAFGDYPIRTIQRYDLSMIPDGVIIQAAEIVIEVTTIIGSGDTVSLYQITDANNNWVEGTSSGATEVGASCWNDHTYQNVTEWAGSAGLSTAGIDYVNTKLMLDLAISTTGSKTLTLNAAGRIAIRKRLDDDDIEFLLHNTTTTQSNYAQFATSEHGTTSYRPYLKITYALATPLIIIRR